MEKSNYIEVVRTYCDTVRMHCREIDKNRAGLAQRLRSSRLLADPIWRPTKPVYADDSTHLHVNEKTTSQERRTVQDPEDPRISEAARPAARGWMPAAIIGSIVAIVLALVTVAILNGGAHRALGIPRESHPHSGHRVNHRASKPGAVPEPRSVSPR